MLRRSICVAALVVVFLLLAALPAAAGGWAVVTLDSLPGEVRAGEIVHLGFMVRQHGNKPVHFLDAKGKFPMTPYLTARNAETGETIRFDAQPGKEVGHFTVEVVFPGEGAWEWEIAPAPLVGVTNFEPLTVLPPLAAKVAPAGKPATTVQKDTVPAAVQAESALAAITAAGSQPEPRNDSRSLLRWGAIFLMIIAALVAVFSFNRQRKSVPQEVVARRSEAEG